MIFMKIELPSLKNINNGELCESNLQAQLVRQSRVSNAEEPSFDHGFGQIHKKNLEVDNLEAVHPRSTSMCLVISCASCYFIIYLITPCGIIIIVFFNLFPFNTITKKKMIVASSMTISITYLISSKIYHVIFCS